VEEPDASSGVPPWTDVAARLGAGWDRLPVADALRGNLAWQVDRHGTMFNPETVERP
jgi:hypothetical protein